MFKKIGLYLIIPSALILIGLGTISALGIHNDASVEQQQLSEKINLALRRTTHLLLKQAGDSVSTIGPVEKTADNTYLVRIESHFNYDSLPTLLQNSFNIYDIKDKYTVFVSNCQDNKLVLGYSSLDFLSGASIPCLGRKQMVGCYNFAVTFTGLPVSTSKKANLLLFLGGLLVLAIAIMAYIFYFLSVKKKIIPPSVNSAYNIEIVKTAETHLIFIGQSIFDTRHQTIIIGENQQKLTFRESKLLQLFCNHQNELLERDVILQQVWEDEGVIVGRSVDVFVSRLRKILKNDASLKITNVHSRGYRFEIAESALKQS
jgi:DNA-binding winged helix-turn-helix (wHTH) protein